MKLDDPNPISLAGVSSAAKLETKKKRTGLGFEHHDGASKKGQGQAVKFKLFFILLEENGTKPSPPSAPWIDSTASG